MDQGVLKLFWLFATLAGLGVSVSIVMDAAKDRAVVRNTVTSSSNYALLDEVSHTNLIAALSRFVVQSLLFLSAALLLFPRIEVMYSGDGLLWIIVACLLGAEVVNVCVAFWAQTRRHALLSKIGRMR